MAPQRTFVYLYDSQDKVAAMLRYGDGDEVILDLTNFEWNDLLVLGVYILYKSSCKGR